MLRKWRLDNYPTAMALMLLLSILLLPIQPAFSAAQPQYQVTGLILDEGGKPLEGVTVSLSNSTVSTLTDQDGTFSIRLVAPTGSLLFTAVGYLDHTLEVKADDNVKVSLTPDDRQLDEVVVIGYGTVRKRDLTGSVTSVKSEDIVRSPAHNPLEAIQGQVPGLDITRNSGSATSGVNMNIRGKRSLSTAEDEYGNAIANNPLVIIDGMQGGNISDIHPQDIESIEVLKDASSTAIYGSQGANGVIIVTTKRGKTGAPKINFNTYVGVNGWAQYPEMQTGEDYIQLRREAAKAAGQWEDSDDDQSLFTAGEWAALQNNQWVNWKDEVFKNGVVQNHQLSISGGTDNTTALLSGGYYRELGSFKNDALDKFNLRLNVDQNIGSFVKVGTSSQVTHYDGSNRADNVLWRATTNVPLGLPYDDEGNVILWPLGREGKVSPLADEANEYTAQHRIANTNLITNGFAEIKPFNGFSVRSNLGVNLFYNKNNDFESQSSIDRAGEFPDSKASILNTNKSFITWDNIINYTFDVAKHNVTLTALSSWTQSKFNSSYMEGTGQLVAEQLWHNIGANEKESYVIRSGYTQNQTMSYAFRANYSYQGKYLLTLSNRWDGASRLSTGNKWAMFPSVAAAWRVSDETWFTVPKVDDFKIRLSYGQTGNSGISPYGTQSGLTAFSNAGFQDQGFTYYTYNALIGNRDLGWERSASWNLGADLRLFSNRINLVVDLYNTKTTDILLPRTLPTSMGSGNNNPFQIYQNIGSSRNRGVEVVLNTKNIDKTFKWNSDFTFGANKEEILDLIDGRDIIGATTRETESLLIGRPLQSFYTFKRLGIWQAHEADEAATYFKDAAKTQPFQPGDIKLADLNGDNVIDDLNDVTYIGTTSPRWTLGFNNSFSYKNFDLNVYAIARWGQMMEYDFTASYDPQGKGNHPAYLDYWTAENPSNDFPRPNLTNFYNYLGYQSYNYIDGSYIKLKTVTVGYRLPKSFTERAGLNGVRLYLSGNNLFSWAKSDFVQDYDAERGGSAKSPLLRQFVFGINLDL
ncbi:TonB-dependent receptor [Sphingobacterium phlebotomi]|uniref:TonB-dependent receptor n=1 Tax=Sphingobacterium phlebotomi TaxID=2605433 RepID=A0A5D4HD05_9SPHI|nr:TonB-dependent receptor [Sphingobacterium phlebotomi]TYR38023.1 TonB-dependent receptor [Sphingobacterium phlebotomi]